MTEMLEISRVFPAELQMVWEAWTDPNQLAKWLGPRGSTCEVKHFDLRPDGYLHSRIEGDDGKVMWGRNDYRLVERPNRIVWIQSFSNEAGEVVRAPFPMPWPMRMLTTVTLDSVDSGTRVNLQWQPLDATEEERLSFAQMMASMEGGWAATFNQLETHLRAVQAEVAM